jgi:hypothetical protein
MSDFNLNRGQNISCYYCLIYCCNCQSADIERFERDFSNSFTIGQFTIYNCMSRILCRLRVISPGKKDLSYDSSWRTSHPQPGRLERK